MFGQAYAGAAYFGGAYFGGGGGGTSVAETSAISASITGYPTLSATISRNPMPRSYQVGSTNTVRVKGPKNKDTREYLDGLASCELRAVYDSAGDPVPGTQNIPLPYVSGVGRSAVYLGAIPHTVPFVDGETYTERVVIEDALGNVLQEDTEVTAVS